MKTAPFAASKQGRLLFFISIFYAASNRERLLIKGGLYPKKYGTSLLVQRHERITSKRVYSMSLKASLS